MEKIESLLEQIKEIDEKNRQKFEYDVAVQVEAARRIEEMYRETNCWECK